MNRPKFSREASVQLRPGYPWLLISGYFVAMFLVGSASVSLARSLVANAMQDMQQTTFPIERSLTRVESWSLYHRLAIVRRPSNQRHIVTAMTAPALPAPLLAAEMDVAESSDLPGPTSVLSAPAKQVTNQGTRNVMLFANRSDWRTRRRSSRFGIDRVAETTSDIIFRSLHPSG